MNEFSINSTFNKKEFILLSFYRMKVLLIIIFGAALWLSAITLLDAGKASVKPNFSIVYLLIAALIVIPVRILYSTRNYSPITINFKFYDEGVVYNRATAEVKIKWQGIHRLHETKRWLLIYTDKINYWAINKMNVPQSEIEKVKSIFIEKKGLFASNT